MENNKIIVYVTKYALTSGIMVVEAEILHSISSDMIKYGTGHFPEYSHAPNWHRKPEEALAMAEKMRVKKIISLKKQIAKLEKMNFSIPVPTVTNAPVNFPGTA